MPGVMGESVHFSDLVQYVWILQWTEAGTGSNKSTQSADIPHSVKWSCSWYHICICLTVMWNHYCCILCVLAGLFHCLPLASIICQCLHTTQNLFVSSQITYKFRFFIPSMKLYKSFFTRAASTARSSSSLYLSVLYSFRQSLQILSVTSSSTLTSQKLPIFPYFSSTYSFCLTSCIWQLFAFKICPFL